MCSKLIHKSNIVTKSEISSRTDKTRQTIFDRNFRTRARKSHRLVKKRLNTEKYQYALPIYTLVIMALNQKSSVILQKLRIFIN